MEQTTAVEQFKALGDPVRWSIVRELRTSTRSARVLADAVEVSPTLLSHHLKVLREAGLIAGVRRGRWIDYTIDTDALAGLATTLNGASANGHWLVEQRDGRAPVVGCILGVMTDQPRNEEEYEPADIDPDDPIGAVADDRQLPVEADPADWADQQRVVSGDPAEDERLVDE